MPTFFDSGKQPGAVATRSKSCSDGRTPSIVARFDGAALRPPMESSQDGEMEKAGVAFKAPPPPEVENPMRRMGVLGLAVLAVIAALFFALRKTTADVQVTTPPRRTPPRRAWARR